MAQSSVTIGQAIDQVLAALESFDEKGKKTILSTVCAHLGVDLGGPAPVITAPALVSGKVSDHPILKAHGGRPSVPVDIRSLKKQKQPKSAIQMACLVAYYLNELAADGEKKPTVKIEDMDKYFKQGGHKLPKNIKQLLVDAKAAGYFDSAGRGEYKLNAVGHNLVAHAMPASQAAK